jgi:hypothetical protein
MAWKGIVGKGFTVVEFEQYVSQLNFNTWKPSFMVLHNTGAPTLAQWMAYPAEKRIKNLENYYKNQQGWSAGPHLFIANDLIWVFTPLTTSGIHTPSWNGMSLGVEMVGDYSREDHKTGDGFKAYKNTVAAFGMLHSKLGIDPISIKLHKEDPRTTHNCPGNKINKIEFIEDVREYMSQAGEHYSDVITDDDEPEMKADGTREGIVKVPTGDTLNVREGSSASSKIVTALQDGTKVAILGEAMNGNTKWYRIWVRIRDIPYAGWVNSKYIN